MVSLILGIMLIGVLVALRDWRQGVMFIVVVGFLQDPLRKLLPGQPVYATMLVGVFFAIVFIALLMQKTPVRMKYLYGNDDFLKKAWFAFIFLIILQSFHSLVRYGNLFIPVFAVVFYLSPIIAIIAGRLIATNERAIRRFFLIYLIFAIPFALTVYLSYWYGDQFDVLKDVGAFTNSKLIIYDMGGVLYSNSGLLRVGESAAWHAAMASIILLVFATTNRSLFFRLLAGLLIALLIGAIILTGRRKMLMTLTIFLSVYSFMLAYYWHHLRRLATIVILFGVVASILVMFRVTNETQTMYLGRSLTVFHDAGGRLDTAWGLFQSGIYRSGFFGVGAGVSVQGVQHFGGGWQLGGAAEAGMGKLVGELGIPGLLILLILLFAIVRYLLRLFKAVPSRYYNLTVLMAAISATLVANAATFLVASQLYGDLFVMLMLGLMAGFLFATESIAGMYLRYERDKA